MIIWHINKKKKRGLLAVTTKHGKGRDIKARFNHILTLLSPF